MHMSHSLLSLLAWFIHVLAPVIIVIYVIIIICSHEMRADCMAISKIIFIHDLACSWKANFCILW